MTIRYIYASGYKTRAAAQEALYDCYATGEISDGDQPRIVSYTAKNGSWRYGIEVNG